MVGNRKFDAIGVDFGAVDGNQLRFRAQGNRFIRPWSGSRQGGSPGSRTTTGVTGQRRKDDLMLSPSTRNDGTLVQRVDGAASQLDGVRLSRIPPRLRPGPRGRSTSADRSRWRVTRPPQRAKLPTHRTTLTPSLINRGASSGAGDGSPSPIWRPATSAFVGFRSAVPPATTVRSPARAISGCADPILPFVTEDMVGPLR